jgi:hypothetical protein
VVPYVRLVPSNCYQRRSIITFFAWPQTRIGIRSTGPPWLSNMASIGCPAPFLDLADYPYTAGREQSVNIRADHSLTLLQKNQIASALQLTRTQHAAYHVRQLTGSIRTVSCPKKTRDRPLSLRRFRHRHDGRGLAWIEQLCVLCHPPPILPHSAGPKDQPTLPHRLSDCCCWVYDVFICDISRCSTKPMSRCYYAKRHEVRLGMRV